MANGGGTAALIVFGALILSAIGGQEADAAVASLRVETYVVAPFVMDEGGGRFSGFSIDLWEEAARRLGVPYVYRTAPNPNAAFDALRSGQADIGVSAAFLTEARNREFDFSVPILEAGQQIMVRETGATPIRNPLSDLTRLLFSRTSFLWLATGLMLNVAPAHFIWLIERRRKDGIVASEKYFPGVLQAAWWSASTLLTQAEKMPVRPVARVFALIWMFSGVVFVALYTAELTADRTVQEIRGEISGPQDLPGRRVAAIAGSISELYVRRSNAQVVGVATPIEGFRALLSNRADAVVGGAPALRYYATHEGRGLVRLVGPEFEKRDIAFVLPDRSSLRKKLNAELLAMEEDGAYDRIYSKWFGDTE